MRCPVCRADNKDGPNCRRCRADLSQLFQIETQRDGLMQQARQQALGKNWSEVSRLAEQAHALRRDTDSGRLAAIAGLLQGNMTQAWQRYPEGKEAKP